MRETLLGFKSGVTGPALRPIAAPVTRQHGRAFTLHVAQKLTGLAVVARLALLASGAGAQTYSLEDLGPLTDLAGRTDSKPYALNALGEVAAGNVIGAGYQAMVYRNSWLNLGTLGGKESIAAGIDDAGRVVGYSFTADGVTNGFLWTPGATDGVAGNPQMKSLGTLGGAVSEAYAINNSGQITGYSDVPTRPNGRQHAFLYSAGTMLDLGQQLSGLPNSFGYSINRLGHVAGTAYDPNYTTPHAFIFDGTTMVDLGVFDGLGSFASAINDQDEIAGYLTTTSSFDHAFSYSRGIATDLGTLGGNYSYALGINNSNTIVGGSFVDDQDSVYHAFAWFNGAMSDLNTELDTTGAGWTLIEARAINDAGQITGVGRLGQINHAFRLTSRGAANPAPKILALHTSDSSVVIQFSTVASRHYFVQTNATLTGASWADLLTNIPGNGNVISVTNAEGVGAAPKFYRVGLLVP